MTDPITPPHQPLAWYPASAPCPRCNQPLKARGTPSWSKILKLLCTKCGWKMDVDAIRTAIKKTHTAPDPVQEDDPNDE